MVAAREDRQKGKRDRGPVVWPWLTVEVCLYAAILGLAAGVRLLSASRWPLGEGQAALALAAWRFARGLVASLRGHSPLLFNLNALLFFITDGSDFLVRLVPMLFGSAVVLLPYGLRRYLGRVGALATALLLAISPSFTFYSRAGDGNVVVACCGLGLVVALAGYLEQRRRPYVWLFVACMVLSLLAGPSAYTLLLIWITFPIALRVHVRMTKDVSAVEELRQAWQELHGDSDSWRNGAVLAGLLLLVFGVGLGVNPSGLQMALDQFGQWVSAFDFLGNSPWYRIPWLVVMYEGLALCFAVLGLLMDRARRDPVTLLLRYWLALTLLFSIVPGYRPPGHVLLVVLPLALAAGRAVENLRAGLRSAAKAPLFWVLLAVTAGVFAAGYVQLLAHLQTPASTYLLRIAALSVFALSSYALVWSLSGRDVSLHAAAASLALILLLGGVRAETRLNYLRAGDPNEPMLAGAVVSPDVLALAREAARYSSQLLGDSRVMDWQIDRSLEVPLGWYLRGFEQISYTSGLPAQPLTTGVIVPAGTPAPARYVGQRFQLRVLSGEPKRALIEWLRWWTGYQFTSAEVQSQDVMMWLRTPTQ